MGADHDHWGVGAAELTATGRQDVLRDEVTVGGSRDRERQRPGAELLAQPVLLRLRDADDRDRRASGHDGGARAEGLCPPRVDQVHRQPDQGGDTRPGGGLDLGGPRRVGRGVVDQGDLARSP